MRFGIFFTQIAVQIVEKLPNRSETIRSATGETLGGCGSILRTAHAARHPGDLSGAPGAAASGGGLRFVLKRDALVLPVFPFELSHPERGREPKTGTTVSPPPESHIVSIEMAPPVHPGFPPSPCFFHRYSACGPRGRAMTANDSGVGPVAARATIDVSIPGHFALARSHTSSQEVGTWLKTA